MKQRICLIAIFGILIISACQKEFSCEDCLISVTVNQPPSAFAGMDTTIIAPNHIAFLNGRKSEDPDNDISEYVWSKVSGPAPYRIVNPHEAFTEVENLVEGEYVFELKVMDASGLSDRDSVQVSVIRASPPTQDSLPPTNLPPDSLQGNVFFYCPDPSGTIGYTWIVWDNGDPVGGKYKLFNVEIAHLSGSLAGVWCKNGCSPRCPIESDYNAEFGNCIGFTLEPGTYAWTAENMLFDNLKGWPMVTAEFEQFFRSTHKAGGTITVNPGDTCIIVPIKF